MLIRILTAVFWITAVAAVCWVAALAWDYDLVAAAFGEKGSRLATTVLMGVLALSSGLLVLYHRGDDDDGDHYWTVAELFYAVFLFLSLFYGVYGFFGWFFYA